MSPRRALRPCGQPGCPELVAGGRCPAHQRVREKDPEQKRFYSSRAWRELSLLVRRQEPICRVCGKAPSQETHHRDGNWRNRARENLEGICRPCHLSVSARQQRGG